LEIKNQALIANSIAFLSHGFVCNMFYPANLCIRPTGMEKKNFLLSPGEVAFGQ